MTETTVNQRSCPSCGVILDPAPTKSRKCPHCSERIVVRTQQGTRVLLREDEVAQADEAKFKAASKSRMMKLTNNLGLEDPSTAWDKTEAELVREWRREPSPQDVFWRLSNRAIQEAQVSNDLQRLSLIYFTQARLLHEEKRDHLPLLREGLRAGLRSTLEATADLLPSEPRVQILGVTRDSLPACTADNNRIITAALALSDDSPVPHSYADSAWCPCTVTVVLDTWLDHGRKN
jgi:predicted RNA-binding Zn-ribbon protein involved in translation (DUF1610 family)